MGNLYYKDFIEKSLEGKTNFLINLIRSNSTAKLFMVVKESALLLVALNSQYPTSIRIGSRCVK